VKRNILLLAFWKSVLISLFVFLLLFLFYSLTELSSSQSMIADGKEITQIMTPFQYWSHFLVTGEMSSILYHRPVLLILYSSFFITFCYSFVSFLFSIVWSSLVFVFIFRCRNFETIKNIRKAVLFLYGFPSSVFVLLALVVFSFGLNWFPSSYQINLISIEMLFPVFILSLLFSFVILFYSFSHISMSRIDEIQFQLRLHKFRTFQKIKFVFNSEKDLIKYLALVFIPILLKGSVFAEILFSIPGISRLLYESMKTHDFPVVLISFSFVAFIYSFVFFISYSNRSKGLSLV